MDSLIPDLKTLVRFALSDLLFDIRRTMPLVAHHGAELDYDKQKPVSGTGVVSKVEWTNPHRRVYVDVTDEKGLVTTWSWEVPIVCIDAGAEMGSGAMCGEKAVLQGLPILASTGEDQNRRRSPTPACPPPIFTS